MTLYGRSAEARTQTQSTNGIPPLIMLLLYQRIIWKYDIVFVTEFPCLLGHPVVSRISSYTIIVLGVGLAMCAIFLLGVKKIFLSKKPKEDFVPSA